MSTPRGERGFTLISVMLALAIISVGLIAVARTQTNLTATQTNTGNLAVAHGIARSYTEELRGRAPATLASEAAVAVGADGRPAAGGPFRRSVQITDAGPNLLRMTVQVDYPRARQPAELVTMVYRPAP